MTGGHDHGHGVNGTETNLDLFIDSGGALGSAAAFAVAAVVFSFYEIYLHLKYYNRPLLQRQIIRIILMVPIYALGSLASLSAPRYSIYFNTVRDVYEAYVIHSFLALMLDFPGGEPVVVRGIQDLPQMKHPWPLCCLPRMRLNHKFIQDCKKSTLQFVFIKPATAFLSLVFMMFGVYESDWWQYILLVVYNVSYTAALYGLLLFYMATKTLLKGFSPVGKFAAVKIIVFATYYQSLLVVAIPGMDDLGSSEKWNDYILCIEMAIFSVMHMYAFSHKEFLPGGVGMTAANRDEEEMPVNLRTDTSLKAVFSRMGDVLSIKDVLEDAARNFRSRYSQYIMQGVEGGIVTEGRADHVMLHMGQRRVRMAGAADAQPEEPKQVVVRERELGTDKEALFASAPDAVVHVKADDGGETVINAAGTGPAQPSATGAAKGTPAAFAGEAEDADASTPYGLIMAVDGVTDATQLQIAVAETEPVTAHQTPHAARDDASDTASRRGGDGIARSDSRRAHALPPAPHSTTSGSIAGPRTGHNRVRAATTDSADDIGAVASAPNTAANKSALIAASAAAAAAAVQAAKAAREAAAASGGAAVSAISSSLSSRIASAHSGRIATASSGRRVPGALVKPKPEEAPVFAGVGRRDDETVDEDDAPGRARVSDVDETSGSTIVADAPILHAPTVTAEEVLAAIPANSARERDAAPVAGFANFMSGEVPPVDAGHHPAPSAAEGIGAAIAQVSLSERQRRALDRQKQLSLSASRVTPAAAKPSAIASPSLATPESWTFTPDPAAADDSSDSEPEPTPKVAAPKSALAAGLAAAAAKLAGTTAVAPSAAAPAPSQWGTAEVTFGARPPSPLAAAAAQAAHGSVAALAVPDPNAPSHDEFAIRSPAGRQPQTNPQSASSAWADLSDARALTPPPTRQQPAAALDTWGAPDAEPLDGHAPSLSHATGDPWSDTHDAEPAGPDGAAAHTPLADAEAPEVNTDEARMSSPPRSVHLHPDLSGAHGSPRSIHDAAQWAAETAHVEADATVTTAAGIAGPMEHHDDAVVGESVRAPAQHPASPHRSGATRTPDSQDSGSQSDGVRRAVVVPRSEDGNDNGSWEFVTSPRSHATPGARAASPVHSAREHTGGSYETVGAAPGEADKFVESGPPSVGALSADWGSAPYPQTSAAASEDPFAAEGVLDDTTGTFAPTAAVDAFGDAGHADATPGDFTAEAEFAGDAFDTAAPLEFGVSAPEAAAIGHAASAPTEDDAFSML